MKRLLLSLPIAALFLTASFCTAAHAQAETADKNARAALATMPRSGRTPSSFVPGHWIIYAQAKGDLNGDGIADHALSITPNKDDPATKALEDADGYLPPTYLIVVLLGQRSGQLNRTAANYRLGPRTFPESSPTVEIKRGVLIVNDNFGTSFAWDLTYRFRYDRASSRFLLIGYDHEAYSRSGSNDRNRTSENYLTGEQVKFHQPLVERGDGTRALGKETVTRGRIPRYRVFIEDVNYDADRESFRPFDEGRARVAPATVAGGGFSGNWIWTGPANKKKEQTAFFLHLKQTGSKVSGNYGINVLVNGEADSDSSLVPLIGTVKGSVLTVEFDPRAEYTLAEENVRYRRPKDRAPSTAAVRMVNGTLQWTLTRGPNAADKSMGIPTGLTLRRNR